MALARHRGTAARGESSAIAPRPRPSCRSRPSFERRVRRTVVRTRRGSPEHGSCSSRSTKRYGVPPRIIVGIWGIESNSADSPACVRRRRRSRRSRGIRGDRHCSGTSCSARSKFWIVATSSSAHARIVGRGDGTTAVHAVQLRALRRRFRRRWATGHLGNTGGDVCVGRKLPEGARMDAGRGDGAVRCSCPRRRPRASPRGRTPRRHAARRRAT